MHDKFVTFCDIRKESTYTKFLKYLTLEKRNLEGGVFDYWVSFDDKCVEISKEIYLEILALTETAKVFMEGSKYG
jgi:predicted RNase H-related nuclease YkuK (DUF458 family)